MDEYYVGEIRIYAFNYAPVNWLPCDGSLLPISRFTALFSVIGNRFGGDGRTTFAVPDLRGYVAQGMSAPAELGNKEGKTTVTLTDENMPLHTHTAYANNARPGNVTGDDKLPARFITSGANAFVEDSSPTLVALAPQTIGTVGGGQPHTNMQPYLPMNFCIAVQPGEYPPRP
ncbi:phage tail protein [Pandoraea oxalativorans]|uniref:Phage tail collar domain-containing protein n=1 Tax=Pandoraea oxalativorans TaxID=573737 RepID=A0A0E3U8Y7_9BURK|nr:tail fiber protein [Pandoraea oxalativorans]AKC71733.1 hypothetical protein MB84_23225 [Pandoraea oxalativorans]